ncbi:type 1 glutamine amidotransferase [Calidifontibacter terrae]
MTVLVIEHENGTGAEFLGECLESAGVHLQVARPYLGESLPELSPYAGLIVLGGTAGPYEDEKAPWLPATRALMGKALADELPMLGVCLGGELLAVVAGGSCRRASAPEVGLHPLTWTDAAADDLLFRGLPDGTPTVEWHWEEIDTLPREAVVLARTAQFPHQAFRVGPAAWGMQFHVEVLSPVAARWARSTADEVCAAGLDPDAVVAEIARADPQLRVVWADVAGRWAKLVLG